MNAGKIIIPYSQISFTAESIFRTILDKKILLSYPVYATGSEESENQRSRKRIFLCKEKNSNFFLVGEEKSGSETLEIFSGQWISPVRERLEDSLESVVFYN